MAILNSVNCYFLTGDILVDLFRIATLVMSNTNWYYYLRVWAFVTYLSLSCYPHFEAHFLSRFGINGHIAARTPSPKKNGLKLASSMV